MSDDIELEEGKGVSEDPVFEEQINILLNMADIDFTALYDDFQEERIKVISTAMKIINARQKNILKELK